MYLRLKLIFPVSPMIALSGLHSLAQVITGKVLDSETGQPLSYVNVGIRGKDMGTVSSVDGNFKLYVTAKNDKDSVKFSMLGYESYSFSIAYLRSSDSLIKVELRPKIYQLNELAVSAKKYHTEMLGNTRRSLFSRAGMGSDSLGCELAVMIKLKHSPAYLESTSFNIHSNSYRKLKLRSNIYSAADGTPAKPILLQPIYIETELKKGIWKIDLAKFNIEVMDDFFIALEYIENLGYQGLYFHHSFGDAPCFIKTTSQADWKLFAHKGENVSMTFNAIVSYQK